MTDDDDGGADGHGQGRLAARQAAPAQGVGRRVERRGQHDREDHRQDDGRDQDGRRDGDRGEPDRDERSPAPLGQSIEPHRDRAVGRRVGGRGAGFAAERGDHRARDRLDEIDDGQRDDQAAETAEPEADRQRHDDEHGVDAEPTATRDPGKDPAEDHRAHDHEQEEDSGRRRPDGRERDEAEQDGRRRRSDIRHEAAHECDHREGPRERHAEQRQADEGEERVHAGHHRGTADVAADAIHRPLAAVLQGVTSPAVGEPKDPGPGLVAVHQQEEGQEPAEQRDRDHGRRRLRRCPRSLLRRPRPAHRRSARGGSRPRAGVPSWTICVLQADAPAWIARSTSTTYGANARTMRSTAPPMIPNAASAAPVAAFARPQPRCRSRDTSGAKVDATMSATIVDAVTEPSFTRERHDDGSQDERDQYAPADRRDADEPARDERFAARRRPTDHAQGPTDVVRRILTSA